MEIVIFIGSLICQLTGGIVLLINNIFISPKRLADEYFSSQKEVEYDMEKNEVKVEDEKLENILMNMYLNRIAFIYLVIGYGFNVLGNGGDFDTKIVMVIIIVCSLLLAWLSYMIAGSCAKRAAKSEKYQNQVKKNVPAGTVVVMPCELK